ncbi:DNA mismatch repair protein mutL [Raoultella planticola]|uniref:DNA mismatch repair protein MutL n=1 Tax=Raoultella planticola TaxID=575 RepID=A0A485ASR4_RAOPL|nr:DNA mismatch repair protein mutL [Raoultella planticola]
MRTEKTEFGHIDEIVRRIALARFDVTINLSHNGKAVRQYRAVPEGGQRERRLGAICGMPFLEHALAIEWQHGDLTLRGWVADPLHTNPTLAEIQYCYVNGRMMRDRLINHAIRQACEDKLGADQQPAFVLYLEIDPHQVDVNVHPAKHEVRFHQSRLVHDFIYQGVLSVLQQQLNAPLAEEHEAEPLRPTVPENRVAAGGNHFAQPAAAREPAAPRYSSEAAAPVSGSRCCGRGQLAACAARLSETAGGALSPAAGNTGGGTQKQRTGTCSGGAIRAQPKLWPRTDYRCW